MIMMSKKMSKMRFFVMLAVLLVAGSVSAQNYVIEPANGGNFADLFHVVASSNPDEPYQGGGYVTNIMKGTKVTIEPKYKGVMDHNFVIITTHGKDYFISADNLKFGENPPGTTNWVVEKYEEPKEGMPIGRILAWVIGIGVALVIAYALSGRSGSSTGSASDDWMTKEELQYRREMEEDKKKYKREEEAAAVAKRRKEEEEQLARWRKQEEKNSFF